MPDAPLFMGLAAETVAALARRSTDDPEWFWGAVAEDLGVITDDVHALRNELGFPGMRVLQFAWDGDPHNPHLPHEYMPNLAAYTGTHDNDTVVGWYTHRSRPDASEAERLELHNCRRYLGTDGTQINFSIDSGPGGFTLRKGAISSASEAA